MHPLIAISLALVVFGLLAVSLLARRLARDADQLARRARQRAAEIGHAAEALRAGLRVTNDRTARLSGAKPRV